MTKKDKSVMVRFSPHVHKRLMDQCKFFGVTMSEFVRALVHQGLNRTEQAQSMIVEDYK